MDKDVRLLFLKLRKAQNKTQDDLEAASGVSQGLISRIEKDSDYQPTTDVFFRAVQGLGLRLSEFFAQLESNGQMTGPVTLIGDNDPASPKKGGSYARAVVQPSELALAKALVSALSQLIKAESAGGLGSVAPAVEQPRPKESGKRQRGAKGR